MKKLQQVCPKMKEEKKVNLELATVQCNPDDHYCSNCDYYDSVHEWCGNFHPTKPDSWCKNWK